MNIEFKNHNSIDALHLARNTCIIIIFVYNTCSTITMCIQLIKYSKIENVGNVLTIVFRTLISTKIEYYRTSFNLDYVLNVKKYFMSYILIILERQLNNSFSE